MSPVAGPNAQHMAPKGVPDRGARQAAPSGPAQHNYGSWAHAFD